MNWQVEWLDEAKKDMRKLGKDHRVYIRRVGENKRIDGGLYGTGKLLEYEVLILHFRGEAACLE